MPQGLKMFPIGLNLNKYGYLGYDKANWAKWFLYFLQNLTTKNGHGQLMYFN